MRRKRAKETPAPAPIGISQSIRAAFRQYATFSGRTRRAEFWWFALAATAGVMVLLGVELIGIAVAPHRFEDGGALTALFGLVLTLPFLSALVRRLHDVGETGWWVAGIFLPMPGLAILPEEITQSAARWHLAFAVTLITLVCLILTIIWAASKSQPGTNRFGPSPLEQTS